jgi:hypothetical protein
VLGGDVQAIGVDYAYVIRRDRGNRARGASTTPGAATMPTDILAPRSDATPAGAMAGMRRAVMLQTAGAADPLFPAPRNWHDNPPCPGGTLTAEERYGIIDGRPVVAPNQPAAGTGDRGPRPGAGTRHNHACRAGHRRLRVQQPDGRRKRARHPRAHY